MPRAGRVSRHAPAWSGLLLLALGVLLLELSIKHDGPQYRPPSPRQDTGPTHQLQQQVSQNQLPEVTRGSCGCPLFLPRATELKSTGLMRTVTTADESRPSKQRCEHRAGRFVCSSLLAMMRCTCYTFSQSSWSGNDTGEWMLGKLRGVTYEYGMRYICPREGGLCQHTVWTSAAMGPYRGDTPNGPTRVLQWTAFDPAHGLA